MKKYFLASIILVLAVLISGCTKQQATDMASLDSSGKYNYKNENLRFSLSLPKEFQYYQTQRKESSEYTDIEIFVPTSDAKYGQEVPGYGKPIVIRVFKNSEAGQALEENSLYKKLGEKNGRAYVAMFWEKVPNDWEAKWSNGMKDEIIKSFKAE